MEKNQLLLTSLMKNVQIIQIEIRSILDISMCSNLRTKLEVFLQEYTSIENEIHTIALQRGWDLPEVGLGKRFWADRLIRLKLNRYSTGSAIADVMIKRNTKDMIQGLKNLHQLDVQDHQINLLSQKMLDCETAHIHQMKPFL